MLSFNFIQTRFISSSESSMNEAEAQCVLVDHMITFLLPLFLINIEYPSSLSLSINESNDTLTAPKKQAGCCVSLTVSNKFNCFSIVFSFLGSFPPDFLAANRSCLSKSNHHQFH